MPRCEIVYCDEQQSVFQLELELPVGCTVAEALNRSGLFDHYPETRDLPVGIFSKTVSLETIVQEGDRLEVYRPLRIDPKEKRRLRAKSG